MVIDFLQTTDFLVFITQSSFQKLLRDNDSKILDSQGMAYGYINEKLSARYKIFPELSKRG